MLDATSVREEVSMARRRFPDEFRCEAVRLNRSVKNEKSFREVADELGMAHETLRAWVRQAS